MIDDKTVSSGETRETLEYLILSSPFMRSPYVQSIDGENKILVAW